MEELVGLFEQMLLKLDDISDTLRDISVKLDNVNGAYSLDDIASKIDEAVSDIVGETRYNLTDIHGDLTSIESTIELKD